MKWLVAWWLEAITWTNVDLYSYSVSGIGRSPRQVFLDHAFMLHCTFFPHLLAQWGVRRAPQVEGVLIGGISCNFADIGPRNSIQLLIRYAMCWECQF